MSHTLIIIIVIAVLVLAAFLSLAVGFHEGEFGIFIPGLLTSKKKIQKERDNPCALDRYLYGSPPEKSKTQVTLNGIPMDAPIAWGEDSSQKESID